MIEDYINKEKVISLLIKHRCKCAARINKYNVLHSVVNHHDGNNITLDNTIYSLFPPRSKWANAGRIKDNNGKYKIRKSKNQVERNQMALWNTYLKAQKASVKPIWVEKLISFAEKIVKMALSPYYEFPTPNVTAIIKDDKSNPIVCRPICKFENIEDKIIASLYNQCLTHLFDNMFYEKSFAFRVHKQSNGRFAHLNAIKMIKDFRHINLGSNLWVAECDMKNFYDTLNHKVIKQRFNMLLRRKYTDKTINNFEYKQLKRIMFSYLDCFNFYDNVFVFNELQNHSIWNPIRTGKNSGKKFEFKWIEEDLKEKYSNKKQRLQYMRTLGVPQGGALSGLIANCMMHFVDIKLKKYWQDNPNFCYIRFCDDMIMIGASKDEIVNAFKDYKDAIDDSCLFQHPAKDITTMKKFWDAKTREPYMWGVPSKNVFPWITFVGYDINWNGDTRIRMKTYKKEIKKQYDKMVELENILKTNDKTIVPIKNSMYIYRALYKRLIGMSVGRFELRDYKRTDNDMSWAQAFTELTFNKWSAAQLRNLDRHRTYMMYKFKKFLTEKVIFDGVQSESDGSGEANPIYFGKSFSYYYQVFKK